MLQELRRIEQAGQPVHFDYLTGPQIQQAQPAVGSEVGAAVLVHGQRYIHPPHFVRSLADSVVERGGKLRERVRVTGVDFDHRQDEWVGSRPCTSDGLPLVGATSNPRVFAAGGHGMWGVALGPVTGRILAEQMMTGTARRARALRPAPVSVGGQPRQCHP